MRSKRFLTNEFLRTSVTDATVRSKGKNFVELTTACVLKKFQGGSSADPDMIHFAARAREGEKKNGSYRIDILRDNVVRLRYTEAKQVPDNPQPFTMDDYAERGAPKSCKIKATKKQVTINTAKVELRVALDPFRIEAYDNAGNQVAGIGGPEKNQFGQWDAVNTAISKTLDTGDPIAMEQFDLRPDEGIYGFGENFRSFNKVGQTLNLSLRDAMGTSSRRAYKFSPFFVSTHGYGAFANTSAHLSAYVGSSSGFDVQLAIEEDFYDIYLFFGDIASILKDYSDLTGYSSMPPEWSFGYWQSKLSYQDEKETVALGKKLRSEGFPCDVIHLDTDWFEHSWHCDLEFGKDRYPDPKAYFEKMAAMGYHVSLWQTPYIPRPSRLYDDLKAVDGFVKDMEGHTHLGATIFGDVADKASFIDFTNPKACEVYGKYLTDLFEAGAAAIKTDFGEDAPIDGLYHNGKTGETEHNLYPFRYNQCVMDVTEKALGKGEAMVWARSGWAGAQRFPVYWGGDVGPNWANLGVQLASGLSFGISACPFWSHDIGGFLGKSDDHDLVVRWYQFGLLNSHSRNHGVGHREPYRLPEPHKSIVRNWIKMRYQMLAYIMGQSVQSTKNALPILRAMVIDFQDDPTTWSIADQYMFGDSLLAAPLFQKEHNRRVYLPAGRWADWWTGKAVEGGQWLSLKNILLKQCPLYIKEGGVIPMHDWMNYIGEKPIKKVTLRVNPLTTKGKRKSTLVVNSQTIGCTYSFDGQAHALKLTKAPSDVKFVVQPVGDKSAEISIV